MKHWILKGHLPMALILLFWQRWSNSFLIKLGNQMKISRCRMTLIGAMQNQEWATIWLKP